MGYKGSKTVGLKIPNQIKKLHQKSEKGIIRHSDDAQSYLWLLTGSLALGHYRSKQKNEP